MMMFLWILCCVVLNYEFLEALVITSDPMNVTVCSGTNAEISCGFTGVDDPFTTRPHWSWRIIKRNNNGYVISNVTVNALDINNNRTDGLAFLIITTTRNGILSANGSYLLVGPVDDTYNNTSYQCIFTINDTIIESDTAGTVTVIGAPSSPVLTYKSTLDEILVSWSPVGSDTVCGPVTYNITVMPSHGMIMMINDTVYNITGLYYNTNYTITVYATNNAGDGEATTVTVKTKPIPSVSNDVTTTMSNTTTTMSTTTTTMSTTTTTTNRPAIEPTGTTCTESDSLSTGAVAAITFAITFIITLTATAIITFIVTYICCVKKRLEGAFNLNNQSPQEKVLYEQVSSTSQAVIKNDLELQPNPAYGTSHKVIMDTNPAYESCK